MLTETAQGGERRKAYWPYIAANNSLTASTRTIRWSANCLDLRGAAADNARSTQLSERNDTHHG